MPNLSDLPGLGKIQQYVDRGTSELHYVRKIVESGAFRLESPLNYAAMANEIVKWGEFGMLPSLNARRHPDRAACIDEDGEFTYKELDDAAHALANALLAKGFGPATGWLFWRATTAGSSSPTTAPPGWAPASSC